MSQTIRRKLEELVGHYASKDNEGEYWGYDTCCGKEENIDQALASLHAIILERLKEERIPYMEEVSEIGKAKDALEVGKITKRLSVQIGRYEKDLEVRRALSKLFEVK